MKHTKTKRAKVSKQMAFEAGSRNVFEDLGLPEPAERLAKAELARVIRKLVSDKGWTQSQAAKTLEITPPDMSDLMRGKLARFSQRDSSASSTRSIWTSTSRLDRAARERNARPSPWN